MIRYYCNFDCFHLYLIFIKDLLYSVYDYYLGIYLTIPVNETDMSSYLTNYEWVLEGKRYGLLTVHLLSFVSDTSTSFMEQIYDCCPEKYQSILLTLKIRRAVDDFSINNNATENEAI
jgi:hypothetical protein